MSFVRLCVQRISSDIYQITPIQLFIRHKRCHVRDRVVPQVQMEAKSRKLQARQRPKVRYFVAVQVQIPQRRQARQRPKVDYFVFVELDPDQRR